MRLQLGQVQQRRQWCCDGTIVQSRDYRGPSAHQLYLCLPDVNPTLLLLLLLLLLIWLIRDTFLSGLIAL